MGASKKVPLGLTSWRLPGTTFDAPSLAAQAGIKRLQIDVGGGTRGPVLHSGEHITRLQDHADSAGVQITAVAVNRLNDLGINTVDSSAVARAVDFARISLNTAHSLGVQTILIPSFRQSSINTDDDLRRTADFLRIICDEAVSARIEVATENVLTAPQLVKLLQMVGRSNLRVQGDVGNLALHGVDLSTYCEAARKSLLGEWHLKDHPKPPLENCQLGAGMAEVAGAMSTLLRLNYARSFVIETDHRHATLSEIREDITWVQNTLTQLER
ncbi:sugar phosphate isomerase/epimerase family protein [Pseudarthrobacter sp. O4]|uniref:sugar phosphate isomerase/epimerase family protein n=1 Tax=Pseudarthrobacter sp. O4 TaxID=3418417 RepID=UPI003CE93D9A